MTEAIFRRRAARAGEVGLFSVDDEGADLLRKLPDSRDVGVVVTRHRNPRHHRLYFAILKFVKMHATNADGEPLFEDIDIETIGAAVKIATGHVRTFVDTTSGKTVFVPKSISWSSMDQTKFAEFFDNACGVIARRWMPPGTTTESVRAELLEMVDGPGALGSKIA